MRREFTKIEEEKIFILVAKLIGTKRLAEQKSRLILNNVKKRMFVTKYKSLDDYIEYTKNNSDENRIFLSNLTIHTTYWFREKSNLDLFENWIEKLSDTKRTLSGLSVGCSTGQEVFSLALIIKNIGINFSIKGIDIDPVSIEVANKGVYSEKELNSIPEKFLKYILIGSNKTKGLITLNKDLRNCCKFEAQNAEKMETEKNYYDFIFCRNMLIYFDENQVDCIIKSLISALVPGGLLILGVSEPLGEKYKEIVPVKPAVFQKVSQELDNMEKLNPNAKKALIIEDSITIRKLLEPLLSSKNHSLYFADSLKSANELLKNQSFDVISLDVNLPDGNGLEWLRNKRKTELNTPVAVLSKIGENEKILFLELFRSGITEFFPKDILNGDSSKYQLFIQTFLGNQRKENQSNSHKLLILDDDKDVGEIFQLLLEQHNYEIISFTDSIEALEHLRTQKVDAILTDFRMPKMDGIEFIRQARSIYPGIPALLVSSFVENRQDLKIREDIDVLDKPIDEIALINSISNLLNSRPKNIDFELLHNIKFPCIVIGASTGGPQTLKRVLKKISVNVPPIVIVQHISQKFQNKFFTDLTNDVGLKHQIVDREMYLENECIYSSHPGKHVCIKQEGQKIIAYPVSALDGSGHTPSVNQLFDSAASLKTKCLAIMLTGMGDDGASAMKKMRSKGHKTVAQDENSIVFGMPRAAIEIGGACFTGSDWDIQRLLANILHQYQMKKIS